MRRLLLDASAICENEIILHDAAEINHVKNVMRMSAGDEVVISDNSKYEYRARIRTIDAGGIIFDILEKQPFSTEPSVKITLFQGIPKHGKLEEIIRKSVELGAFEVVPVSMARSIPKAGSVSSKIERYRRIALEASKQSGRGIVPEVCDEIPFSALIEKLRNYDFVLFPYEEEKGFTIKEALRSANVPQTIAVLIGPEGGFSDAEAAALVDIGLSPCSLGKRILRTETAGPAVIAMVLYELEL